MNPPGDLALAFASRWFDEATVRGTFEPLIADWQREWQDATPSARRRVSIGGLTAFLYACLISSPKIAVTVAPPEVTDRIAACIARFTLLTSLILAIPTMLTLEPSWLNRAWVVFALPGILTFAFPFSLISAVDAIRCSQPLPRYVERATAAKLGLVSIVLMFVFSGWVVPAANTVWRSAMAPSAFNDPGRGIRELSTYELVFDPSRATVREGSYYSTTTLIRREISTRASIAILPVLFIWLRWGDLSRPRRKWYSPLPSSLATIAAIVAYLALWFVGVAVEIERLLPYSIGMWVPTLGLIAIGLAARTWRRRHSQSDRLEAL